MLCVYLLQILLSLEVARVRLVLFREVPQSHDGLPVARLYLRLLDEVRDAEASFPDDRLHLLDRRRLAIDHPFYKAATHFLQLPFFLVTDEGIPVPQTQEFDFVLAANEYSSSTPH